jgi:hypothetical protein
VVVAAAVVVACIRIDPSIPAAAHQLLLRPLRQAATHLPLHRHDASSSLFA